VIQFHAFTLHAFLLGFLFCKFMSLFLDQSVSFAQAISQLRDLPILVLGHRRPDGDCIGSQVAMTRVLLALGKMFVRLIMIPFPARF
jgi:hypothetical protein